ncbi:CDP-glycerol glycerophosphotransferase family protein [Planococcus versutus]|uniref:CDP-glycerol glycerophosphotransferase family protein n=1 Tax=Planococcus versutus TaxID=1302659 RepID=UPI00069FC88E|nr:CDP-glycerol glycerophosphotransferase family protein [Planococcus versutus]
MEIFNSKLQIVKESLAEISFFMLETEGVYALQLSKLEQTPIEVGVYEAEDQVLFVNQLLEECIIGYVQNDKIYITKFNHGDSADFYISKNSMVLNFEIYSELLIFKQTGDTTFSMYDHTGNYIDSIHDLATFGKTSHVTQIDLGLTTVEYRFLNIGKINCGQFYMFVIYDLFRKELVTQKVIFTVLLNKPNLDFNLSSPTSLDFQLEDIEKNINLKKLAGKSVKIADKTKLEKYRNKHLLGVLKVNGIKYYLHNRTKGIYMTQGRPTKISSFHPNLKVKFLGKNLYIFGRNTHYAYKASGVYDYLYVGTEGSPLTKFVRPLNFKLVRRYGFFKIPIASLNVNNRIHTNLYLGDQHTVLHNLKLNVRPKRKKTLDFKLVDDQVNIVRTNLRGDVTSTILSKSEEYTFINRNLIFIAHALSKWLPRKKENINLYFEKKSMKADESGIRVFEQVMKESDLQSKNFFILSKDAENYKALKNQYKRAIVSKFSFKHYYLIFRASNLISSELSNHLLNDRLYIDVIREKINSIPLTFLQHGIMFAKPVDNPMAFGFHKDKNVFNMRKSVISSELEAGEFYKMGYDREDLILTGLATFDHAKLNEDADKIAFMPTYRYWEEGLIYRGLIEQTTYYTQIIRVIEAFEKNGLLDRLLIVPHNKFSEHIYENMQEYQHIISNNPSEALKNSVVFITDYSSAIYDATFRGAYPIFYWEEKEYLINQYKAIPPVNDENAPGAVIYDLDDLIEKVKDVIAQNYKVEDEIMEKFQQINTFMDRKNILRIVESLKQDRIL